MVEGELEQVGPYPILQLLSRSSSSSFYRSKLKKKEVVVQRLHVPLSTPEGKEAFLLRAKQLKKLKVRGLLAVYDFGFASDYPYLVMEHIVGKPLHEQLVPGKVTPGDARSLVSVIATALQYAHMNNTPHGNLHPGTLLFNERNEPYLTAFALSLPEQDFVLTDEAFAIPYMAPEHLSGQLTPASDQYALAAIAYELVCGRRPYDATEHELLLQQQQAAPIPEPRTFNDAISPVVEQVLLRALSFEPNARFERIQDFSDGYLHALMGLPLKTTSGTTANTATRSAPAPQPPVEASTISSASAPKATPSKEVPITATAKQPASDTTIIEPEKPVVLAASPNNARFATTMKPEVKSEPTSEPFSVPATKQAALPLVKQPSIGPTKGIGPDDDMDDMSDIGDIADLEETALQRKVANDLRQGGILSQRLPGYEERPAQVEMASLIARALNENVPTIIEAGTGTGKALDVDTPIPTPTGWKPMGELVVGDIVFDEHGQPTRVTAAFDVMHNRPCYEVVFSDGSSLVADAEHEWASYTSADRRWPNNPRSSTPVTKNFVTIDKLALLDELIKPHQNEHALSIEGAARLIGGHRWSVFQAAHEITPVNPGGRPARYPFTVLLKAVRARLAKDLSEHRRDGRAYTLVTTRQMKATLTVGSSARANHAIAVANALTLPDTALPIAPYFLGAWLGIHHKHIPPLYLRASEQQRRALLAGLLDTDGTVNRSGAVEFTTTSPQLAQDVYELVCSLGFRPSLRCGRARCNGKDCGPKWTLAFTTEQQVFRLERKVQAQKERLRNYSPERNRFRYVVAIHEVPSRPVRCIQVDAPSHLYLAGRSMIPTHNSLAYLVPIVRSGKVAIVSTANKALQEQLFYKDIPFVQKHIQPFEAALVKGVSNYVCIDRMETERTGMQFYTKNVDFRRLVDIVNDPEAGFMGDFETLGFQLSSDIRSRVATDSDQCAWNKCSYFGECYVKQMRDRAELAQVIVVNHTLLLLDAAIGGFLLPSRDVIVLDEAHHLEEEATRSFTITISPHAVELLLAQRMLKTHSQLSLQAEADRAFYNAWESLRLVADPGFKGRMNLTEPLEEGLKLATAIADLADSLRKQRPKNLSDRDEPLYDKLLKRTQNLAENVRTVFSVADPKKFVYYVERVQGTGGRNVQLQVSAAPLDVTSWLRERLFDKCNVISTSATLATIGPNPAKPDEKGPNFAYFRRRVGLDPIEQPEVLERILPLAFDYENNALLYLPRDLPEPAYGPGAENYMKAIAREMYKLVKTSHGRAFLLFSSKRMLDYAYELMSPHLNFPLLKQGDMTRIELTRRFREEEGAVLFGLKSFWEGVDIAGNALSLVVIDKLPFDPPDDPVHEARVALMKAAGENWFGTYVLPQAVLRLKQGLGRLLRTREDRGVMAILDTRLHTKGYGKMVLNALPPARRTASIREVEQFFNAQE